MTCFTAATALAFATAATRRDLLPSGAVTSTGGIPVRTFAIFGICAAARPFPATQTDVGESPASLPAIGSGSRSALTQPSIEAIRSLVPDIAILDISLPGLTGLEILAIANSENLSTRLVFFTASVEDRELIVSAAAGAYAVILKDVALEILVQSLRQVGNGPRPFPPLSSDQAVSSVARN